MAKTHDPAASDVESPGSSTSSSTCCSKLQGCASRRLRWLAPVGRIIITILLAPLAIAVLLPVLLYRLCARAIVRCRYGPDASFMGGLDTAFSRETSQCRSIINSLFVLEGDLDLTAFRNGFLHRYLQRNTVLDEDGKKKPVKLEQYRDRQFGYWLWLPPNTEFDLSHHIRLCEGVSEQEVVTESRVMEILSGISNQPFQKGKPAWEFLFLPKFRYNYEYTSKTSGSSASHCAVIFRIHHSYGDGISLMRAVMASLMDNTLEAPFPIPPRRSFIENIGLALWALSYVPKNLLLPFVAENNALRGPRLSGEKTLAWSRPVDMQLIKNIKKKTNSTVTDILLSSVAECLHCYFVQKEGEGHAVPNYVNAVIPVPVKFSSKEEKIQNVISPLLLRLPTAPMHPLQRLSATNAETKKQRRKPHAYTNYWSLRFLLKLLPEHMTRYLSDRVPSTLVLSNLPGPTNTPILLGSKMVDFMFWVPNKGDIGVGVSLLSLTGRVRMGLYVDTALISDRSGIEGLLTTWEQQLHQLNMAASSIQEETGPPKVTK